MSRQILVAIHAGAGIIGLVVGLSQTRFERVTVTGAVVEGRVSCRGFLRKLGMRAPTVFVVADGGLAYRV